MAATIHDGALTAGNERISDFKDRFAKLNDIDAAESMAFG
jgi:hypothetical protein